MGSLNNVRVPSGNWSCMSYMKHFKTFIALQPPMLLLLGNVQT